MSFTKAYSNLFAFSFSNIMYLSTTVYLTCASYLAFCGQTTNIYLYVR